MRLFDDHRGRRWEAVAAFGSYGEARLIFSRMDGNELRIAAAKAATLRGAVRDLETLTDEALRELLGKSEPWQA